MRGIFVALLLSLPILAAAQAGRTGVPAFPGADGAGKYATGGAGGKVYTVTKLDDDGSEGTLRWAVKKKGPRTVVFQVSGVIELTKELVISEGNLTIAGQTAPGDGICLKRFCTRIGDGVENVIIRFMRFRLGDQPVKEGTEEKDMDTIWGRNGKRIIIDHCSMSWCTDECASFYGNQDFTMQWCIISESLYHSKHPKGNHGYGGIWGGEPASFHHNLLAHHTSRVPRLCGSRWNFGGSTKETEKVDIRNNVFYNWGPANGGYAGEGGSYNFVANYYKPGPMTATKKQLVNRIFAADSDNGKNGGSNKAGDYGIFWLKDNVFDGSAAAISSRKDLSMLVTVVNMDNWAGFSLGKDFYKYASAEVKAKDLMSAQEFDIQPKVSFSEQAADAYKSVTAYAGASLRRDRIDARIVEETIKGSYTYKGSKGGTNGMIDSQEDVGGWPEYKSEPAPKDSDKDGMPDDWETQHGLNSNDASDSASYGLSKSYTNLEVYLNSLVEGTFPKEALK